MRPIIPLVTPLIAAIALATPAFAAEPDWGQVAQALGKSGGVQAGGVYRVGLPRTDLKVTLDGVELRRALRSAAGSPSRRWAARPWSWATSC